MSELPFPSLSQIRDPGPISSPGLVFFLAAIEHNLESMIEIAGGPERLCPHVKTHKTREIVSMQLDRGVRHHKCATIAEAEMLAELGVPEIFLAYPLVGPNLKRLRQLSDTFPAIRFATLADCLPIGESLSHTFSDAPRSIGLFLDLDPGMHRTGIAPGPEAIDLYEQFAALPGIELAGLHWYDGHHRQPDLAERTGLVTAAWSAFTRFRNQLMLSGLPIPRVVTAGSGSFPILAEMGEPNVQLSPGTTTLWDAEMAERFPEQPFRCALAILTRVVSRPQPGQLTLDVGHKACAADQPAGRRLVFPDLPDAEEVGQTEEHLVVKTSSADSYQVGDPLLAIPRHACPTSAVHDFATVIGPDGEIRGEWNISARGRRLTI